MFLAHTTAEEFKNATITSHSHDYLQAAGYLCFRKAPVSKEPANSRAPSEVGKKDSASESERRDSASEG